MYKNIGAS